MSILWLTLLYWRVTIFFVFIFICEKKKLWIQRLWTRPFRRKFLLQLTMSNPFMIYRVMGAPKSRVRVLSFSFPFGLQSAIAKEMVYHAGWENRISIWNSPFKPALVRNVRFYLLVRNMVGLRSAIPRIELNIPEEYRNTMESFRCIINYTYIALV